MSGATAWAGEYFQASQARFADVYRAYAAEHYEDYSSLQAELANLTIAVRWCLEQGERERAVELVATLSSFWLARGYWAEAAEYADVAAARQNLADHPPDGKSRQDWVMLRVVNVVALWLQGQHDAARDSLGSLIAASRTDADKTIESGLGLLTGLMTTASGQEDEAIALYRMALEQVRELNHPPTLALVLDMLAQALAEQGLYTEAIGLYQEKLQLIRQSPDPTIIIETLRGLAVVARSAGLMELAESCLEDAAELALRHAPLEQHREARADLAAEASRRGDFARAAAIYRELVDQARLQGDRPAMADMLRRLAFAEDELGKDVGEILEESLSLSRQIADAPGMARSLLQLGEYHYDRGEADRAQNCYEQATGIAARINDPALEALAWEGIADLAFDRDAWEEAERGYARSVRLHEAGRQAEGQARTLHRLGQVLASENKRAEAATAFRAAMDLNERLGDREAYAAGLYGLAQLWADEGRPDEACQFGQAAVEILKSINSLHVVEVEQNMTRWVAGNRGSNVS